jgi:hypothetical protein
LASGANYNSLLGFGAGTALTTGNANTFLGTNAGTSTTTGSNNIYIGYNAAGSTSGNSNEIVIGQGATGNGTNTVTIGNSSTFKTVIGGITLAYSSTFSTLYLGTLFPVGLASGATTNTFIGEGAATKNTTGARNTIMGFNAGYFNITGSRNTCIGDNAGAGVSTFSSSDNTFIGQYSGLYTVGGENVCVGQGAGAGAISGASTYSQNAIVGKGAGFNLTTASGCTFVGFQAGPSVTTGGANTIVGKEAGFSLTTGTDNVYLGLNAGFNNRTGSSNTYIGLSAGQGVSGQSNSENTGVGYGSLLGITTGTKNVCVGFNCGRNITTGSKNTALGDRAMECNTTPCTGDFNTALGHFTLTNVTTGNHNTVIGVGSGSNITTGTHNICIGVNNVPLGIADQYCTIIGGAGNVGFGTGTALIATGANGFYLPGYTTAGTLQNTATGQVISVSDIRVKSNIIYLPTSGSTDTIMGLKPVSFDLQFDPYKRYTGFIADEVQLVMPGCVDGKKHKFQYETEDEVDASGNVTRRSYKPKIDANGNVIYKKDENGQLIPRHLGMDYNEITSRLVLAFQEQVGIIQQQATTIISLQSQVTTQQTQMEQILQRLTAANIA